GRNDGFVLDNARIGLRADMKTILNVTVALEGASDLPAGTNTPSGELDVRLRDAFGRFDPVPYIGLQVGQFEAPFDAEELRHKSDLLFASLAVGQEGVLPGRGLAEPGIAVDRQLGAMLSPRVPIFFGKFGAAYYLMVANGNEPNQLLDDNGKPAIYGR